MEYRRLGVPMPEGGGLLSTVRDIALGFAGGHGGGLRVVCDLYAGFVPRMLADSFLMPLVNPETWYVLIPTFHLHAPSLLERIMFVFSRS